MDIEKYIIHNVEDYIGKKLSPSQKNYVLSLYSNIDKKIFVGHQLSKIGPILGKVLGDKLLTSTKPSSQLDVREYQIKTLNERTESDTTPQIASDEASAYTENKNTSTNLSIDKFLGIDDITELKLLFNPESLYVHYYLVLDTDYRNRTAEVSSNITKFRWNYTPTQNISQVGFCNSVGVIRDIIGIRLYQPRVPNLPAMNTDAKRVSILIEEFQSQAFICENNRRFHFLLQPIFPDYVVTSIELSTEDYNDGIFTFRKPITTFDTITISFADPINILSFTTPFDRFYLAFEFVCYKSDK